MRGGFAFKATFYDGAPIGFFVDQARGPDLVVDTCRAIGAAPTTENRELIDLDTAAEDLDQSHSDTVPLRSSASHESQIFYQNRTPPTTRKALQTTGRSWLCLCTDKRWQRVGLR